MGGECNRIYRPARTAAAPNAPISSRICVAAGRSDPDQQTDPSPIGSPENVRESGLCFSFEPPDKGGQHKRHVNSRQAG